jgi:hypothetical protein
MTADLAAIRARWLNADIGDWFAKPGRVLLCRKLLPLNTTGYNMAEYVPTDSDAVYLRRVYADERALLDAHDAAQQRIAALEGALSDVESLCQFYVDGEHPSVEAAQLMNRMISIIRAALEGADDDR